MSTMLLRLITSRAARCCSFQAQRLASSKVVIALPHHHQMGGGVAYSYPRQSFHNSTRRCASVSDDELPQQLKDQPGLMEKVHKFMRLLESKGVDIRSGKPPGLTQMAKLAMDGEVRDATTEVTNALKEAGINFSPTQISSLMQGWKDGNKGGSEEK